MRALTMGSGPRKWRPVFPSLRRGEDMVCVCYVVAASFKIGLGGNKQRFLVNRCLLSCHINTITINTNNLSIWAQYFSAKLEKLFLVYLAAKLQVCLVFMCKSHTLVAVCASREKSP